MELQKDGIDIVDLTPPFQAAAAKEQKKNTMNNNLKQKTNVKKRNTKK